MEIGLIIVIFLVIALITGLLIYFFVFNKSAASDSDAKAEAGTALSGAASNPAALAAAAAKAEAAAKAAKARPGRCGPEFGDTSCPAGECCSSYGYCGCSPEHCAYGKFNGPGPLKCGCGPNHENRKCTDGTCCSSYGMCECSNNCNNALTEFNSPDVIKCKYTETFDGTIGKNCVVTIGKKCVGVKDRQNTTVVVGDRCKNDYTNETFVCTDGGWSYNTVIDDPINTPVSTGRGKW